jgi:hypothetical protein
LQVARFEPVRKSPGYLCSTINISGFSNSPASANHGFEQVRAEKGLCVGRRIEAIDTDVIVLLRGNVPRLEGLSAGDLIYIDRF